MAQRAVSLVACAVAASLWCGCSPYGNGGSFTCSADEQCGAGGTCTSGYCAFPDGMCMSGLRYGELSGPQSGQCVGDSTMEDASVADVPVDTMIQPSPDGTYCYGSGLVHACFQNAPPSGTRTLNAAINTDTSNLCDTGSMNTAWCVIAAQTITVQGTVTATGSKPLVLLATGTIDIQGTLDVASHRTPAVSIGAAANPATCGAGTAPATSGGGAGGSFGGKGGDGGGTNNTNTAGGKAANAMVPNALRGGCKGQNGNGGMAGTQGNGGGAVYLIAETSITITGAITASGSSGTGGAAAASGAGGGGSGGYIGLDTPTVTNNGVVVANGGGGGEGSGQMTAGNDGADPLGIAAGAGGANGTNNGGDGGNGAAGATLTGSLGSNGQVGGGGGAGGGGAGIIDLVRATTIGGQVSPPAT